jgi:hypothetical protein
VKKPHTKRKMIYATTSSPSSIGNHHFKKVNPIIIITVKANKGKEYSTSHKNRQRSDVGSAREHAGQKRNNE